MGYADSTNLYQGFGGNPANMTDPMGLETGWVTHGCPAEDPNLPPPDWGTFFSGVGDDLKSAGKGIVNVWMAFQNAGSDFLREGIADPGYHKWLQDRQALSIYPPSPNLDLPPVFEPTSPGEARVMQNTEILANAALTLACMKGSTINIGQAPGPVSLGSVRPRSPNTMANRGVPNRGASGRPAWLDQAERGTAFNKARAFDYPVRELYLDKPGGGYVILDAYDPVGREIVSRKLTQLGQVQESTAVGYLSELATKYPAGARIANVPSSGPLAGQFIRGQQILEVPIQTGSIPSAVLNEASRLNIVIRDVAGNVYR